MEACSIIPQIKNTITGEIEDSKLYIDLLKYTGNNRSVANDIYYRAINPDFTDVFSVEFDERNQPTFDSLYEIGELDKYIPEKEEINNIKRDLGLLDDKGSDKEFYSQSEAFNASNTFNNIHVLKNKYIALPKRIINSVTKAISYIVEFVKNSLTNKQFQIAHELNNNLRNTIIAKFQDYGIGVGSITEAERRQGILGIIDFDIMHNTDKVMVEAVRIAEGKKGTEALLEEHIHFLVDINRNNPLIERAFNLINNNNLVKEILGEEYEEYSFRYGTDSEKLIYEAVGKLIYQQVKGISTNSETSFLVNRVWTSVKNWATNTFSKNPLNITKVNLNKFAINEYLSPKQKEFLKRTDTNLSGVMYDLVALQHKNKDISEALKNAFMYEKIRYDISSKQAPNDKRTGSTRTLHKLKDYLKNNTPLAMAWGTISYINNMSNSIEELQDQYESAKSQLEGIGSITPLARAISQIDTFVQMANEVITPMTSALMVDKTMDSLELEVSGVKTTFEEVKTDLIEKLNEYKSTLSQMKLNVLMESKNILIDFYGEYLNENPSMLESVRRCYEKTYGYIIEDSKEAATKVLEEGISDLNWYSRFGITASQAPDFFIQMTDDILKQTGRKELLNNINSINELKAARKLLEKTSRKDDKFMYERDSNGKPTGYAICKGHWGNYIAAQEAMNGSLQKLYEDGEITESDFFNKKYAWFKANTSKDDLGNTIPNPKIYPNSAYEELTPIQKEYHSQMITRKAEEDRKLPNKYFQPYLVPQIRQDFYNSIMGSKGFVSAAKNIWQRFRDEIIIREDETGYGDLDAPTNIKEGTYLKSVPIYFTRKLKDMSDLNTDYAGSMISYSMMANHYDHFSSLADVLALTKDVWDERSYAAKNKYNRIPKVKGFHTEDTFTKKVTKQNAHARKKFEYLLDTNIYDITKAVEHIGSVRADKVADALLKFNSMNKMGFNALSQITNTLNSKWQIFIEGTGGEIFKYKDLVWSEKEFIKQMPNMVSETGQRIKQNKITLLNDFFNIRMDFNGSADRNLNQRNLASKVFDTDMFYMLNNMSEFYSYSTVMLAVLNKNKVFDTKTNKEISLYDALELENITDSKNLGKRVKIKEGVVQADGKTPIDSQYIHRISRLMQGLGKDMFGVYSTTEKTELNKYLIGRMATQFRGYFMSNLHRRYGKSFYNSDYGMEREGYYRTLGKVLKNSWGDLIKLNFMAAQEGLTPHQKANLKKAITELSMYLLLFASSILLGKMGDDDEELDKENWMYNLIYYTNVRLGSEVGAFMPLPFGMPLELQRQISSPIPGVSLVQQIGNILSPQKAFRTVETGFWKDHLYLEQYTAYLIPGFKSITTFADVSTMRRQRGFFQDQGFSIKWFTDKDD